MHDGVTLAAPTRHAPSGLRVEGAFACLLPWLLATFFAENAELSWWISWAGSWLIIALVFSGRVFHVARDRPAADQVMRPYFLMHLVFAGYNFMTAVFYWLDLNGITLGLAEPLAGRTVDDITLAAQAQRLYVLAHAGLVIGIGIVRQVPRRVRVQARNQPLTKLLLAVVVGSAALAYVMGSIPGLGQFQVKMHGLFIVAAAVGLGVAMHERSRFLPLMALVNLAIFFFALISGWKGEPIVMIILVASAFYPRVPLRTLSVAGFLLVFGVFVLPSISSVIRGSAWSGEATKVEAFQKSYNELQYKPKERIMRDSWKFLTDRLSEEGLFVRYLEVVPSAYPFYEGRILAQAAASVVPRALWADKPDLEEVVRERVLMLDIVDSTSEVSAKPQYVVDGFLSYGALGVFLSMLLYGVVAQLASNTCATWLGGYVLGGIAFNGLFAILWQGSAFEFVFNAVFWSFVSIFVLSFVGRAAGVLRR